MVKEKVKAAERLLGKCGTDDAKRMYLDKYLRSLEREIKIAQKTSEKIRESHTGLLT